MRLMTHGEGRARTLGSRGGVASLGVALAVAVIAMSAAAQVDGATASFGQAAFADVFELPVGTPGDRIRAHVAYSNAAADKGVSILFRYQKAGATPRRTSVDYATKDFRPTFTVPRAGTSDVLYVGGWSSRTDATIIEKWTLEYALGSSVNPATLEEISTLAVSPRKETVAILPGRMILHASSNPYGAGDHLYLLEKISNGRNLVDLDVADGTTTVLFSGAESSTAFGTARSIHTGYSTTDGVITYTEPNWEWDNTLWQAADEIDVLMVRDPDADGAIDTIAMGTFDDLSPFLGTWDHFHAVP